MKKAIEVIRTYHERTVDYYDWANNIVKTLTLVDENEPIPFLDYGDVIYYWVRERVIVEVIVDGEKHIAGTESQYINGAGRCYYGGRLLSLEEVKRDYLDPSEVSELHNAIDSAYESGATHVYCRFDRSGNCLLNVYVLGPEDQVMD